MSLIDFESFDPKSAGGNATGKIVFVRAKNCPLTFFPVGKLWRYQSVYDEATKRNRKPRAGDAKVSTRYLVNGVDIQGEVHAYDLGATVVGGIKDVREILSSSGMSPTCFVEVTSSGSGMDTTYTVRPAKLKLQIDQSKLELHDLSQIEKLIVGEDAKPAPQASGAPTAKNADAFAFA